MPPSNIMYINYKPTSKNYSKFKALYPTLGKRKLNEIYYLFFIGIIFFISGCSSNNSNQSQILILPYSAFGPPTMSGSLLGVEWFQWQPHGDSRPKKYDVNIVVYRNIALAEVKSKYPISEKQKIDYRYVTYSDSITYFNESIIEVLNMHKEGYPMGPYIGGLRATKKQIIDKLGD